MASYSNNDIITGRYIFNRVLGLIILIVLVNEGFALFGPFSEGNYPLLFHLLEDVILIVISGPVLWYVIARPLQRYTDRQRVYIDTILKEAVEAIITLNDSGMIIGCNQSAEKMFVVCCEELYGRPVSVLFANGNADSHELLLSALQANSRDASVKQKVTVESGIRSTGEIFTMEVSFSAVSAHGITEVFILVRDIEDHVRAQKEVADSEAKFRQIFEQSADAIVLFDLSCSQVIDVNQVMVRLFGYTKSELMDGMIDGILGPSYRTAIRRQSIELHNELGYWVDIMKAQRKDGSELHMSLRCRQIELGNQDIILCTIRDISERVKEEEKNRSIEAKLIQANKMTSLGVLVSGIAHEINNPNNYIMLSSEMLSRSWKDVRPVLAEYHSSHADFSLGGVSYETMQDEIQELIDNITGGSRRIRDIVRELKDFAREGSSGVRSDIDINKVIQQATQIINHQIRRHTKYFKSHFSTDLPHISGNAQQLEQVFINLILNALQALPDKNCLVKISTEYDRAADVIRVDIFDQGIGIAGEHSNRIMETFFTTKKESGGTGLGLSISRSIIRDHGGDLIFTSAPDLGTTFTVQLPVIRLQNGDQSE